MFIFAQGTTRNVLAIPYLGVVLKTPRIRWATAFSIMRDMLWALTHVPKHFLKMVAVELSEYTVEYPTSIKGALFAGVVANWREKRFCKHTSALHRLMLQPVYFSFFGILNVQKYGMPADEEDGDAIFHAFSLISGSGLLRDGHHWAEGSNFHLAVDGPKMLDYGSIRTQGILEEFGPTMYVGFDLGKGREIKARYKRVRE